MSGSSNIRMNSGWKTVYCGWEANCLFQRFNIPWFYCTAMKKTAGHFGFVKTLHLVKCQFWWPRMKKEIENYVASCPVCASAKRPPRKTPGLLQAMASPTAPWKEIPMDFIVELPESTGNTVIWVIMDFFSKQAHFVACPNIPSARTLAKVFVQNVYRLHVTPTCIISDRGVQFTSKFWQEFPKLLDSSHHLQTNGVCEHRNAVLQQYLRCYVNYQWDNWAELSPFAKVAYNNSMHTSTGFTPFQVATGLEFMPMPELPQQTPLNASLTEWINVSQNTWPMVHRALDDAREVFKRQADRKRVPQKEFRIGDRVYLSTKFLQSRQPCKKLNPKYIQ